MKVIAMLVALDLANRRARPIPPIRTLQPTPAEENCKKVLEHSAKTHIGRAAAPVR